MDHKPELKDQVKSWQRELNKLIAQWDLMPGSPHDEFEALTHTLIGHLSKGTTKEKLYDVLKRELIARYGLSPAPNDLEQFAEEVTEWWDKKGAT